MNPYIALTRPGNAVLTAIAVIAGAFIASGPEIVDYWEEIAICCISAMMLVGGGNALNDYNDRETDKENHPNRPIPSGEISAETALNYSNILLGAGLVILWFTLANWMVFIIALIGVLTLIAYENGLKAAGLAGNIVRVLVGNGEKVERGQVLLILEAMKMETEVVAPCGGTIIDISISDGDAVAVGDNLISLSKV